MACHWANCADHHNSSGNRGGLIGCPYGPVAPSWESLDTDQPSWRRRPGLQRHKKILEYKKIVPKVPLTRVDTCPIRKYVTHAEGWILEAIGNWPSSRPNFCRGADQGDFRSGYCHARELGPC
jgi:hypothetical protein